MKKRFFIGLGVLGTIIAIGIAWTYYENVITPRISARNFCELWKLRLSTIRDPDKIPREWQDTVYVRRFDDGWIVAAFYHGSCTEAGAKAFNASVYWDCLGHLIVYPDYSPCDSGVEGIGHFWEVLSPAKTFSEYNSKYKDGPPKSG